MGGMMSSMMGSGQMQRPMNDMMSSRRGKTEMAQMMGSADTEDMQVYMEMFQHHSEIRRSVEQLKNGVRTVTESSNPRIAAFLQSHVAKMYQHVAQVQEVRCMSDSLPTMFRNSSRYRRRLMATPHGVAIEETRTIPRCWMPYVGMPMK